MLCIIDYVIDYYDIVIIGRWHCYSVDDVLLIDVIVLGYYWLGCYSIVYWYC